MSPMTPAEITREHLGIARVSVHEFLRFRPQARHLAEDLYGVAVLAMCEDAPKWEPERGIFSSYIFKRVRRALDLYWGANAGPVKRTGWPAIGSKGASMTDAEVAALAEELTALRVRTPEEVVGLEELADLANRKLAEVDPRKVECLLRRTYERENVNEIAKSMQVSARSVRKWAQQAREFVAEAS